MGDEGDIWNHVREQKRLEKERRRKRLWPIIEQKITELSAIYPTNRLTEYQVRFGKCLDIYPENKRYHIICARSGRKNERGGYEDMTKFVKTFFNDHQHI